MLVLVAVLLTLIPLMAIAYPFIRSPAQNETPEDESSPHAELERRWESALAGLRSTEVEYGIGTLSEEDYRWLREQQMVEAAQVMKAMELEEDQQQAMLSRLFYEHDANPSDTPQPSSDDDATPSNTPHPFADGDATPSDTQQPFADDEATSSLSDDDATGSLSDDNPTSSDEEQTV